jgi:hypothetical protein
MAQLAVFDKFYGSEEFPLMDAVTPVLQSDGHEVIANSTTIRGGALAIVAMKNGDIATPDIVVVGGRLYDDRDYTYNPAAITERVEVPTRTLRGRRKQAVRNVTTTLLPVPERLEDLNTPVLPATHNSPVKPKQVPEFAAWMDVHFAASGRAAYILSHLTRLLLGDGVKIVGISSYNDMRELPVAACIERGANDSDMLRKTIRRLMS